MNDKIYLMISLVRPWLFKLGVSNRVDLREKQVGAKSIFSVRLPWAYTIEAALHGYLKPTNVRTWGSGSSEWFISCNPILALLLLNAQLWLNWFAFLPPHAAVVVLLLPIPLDAMLLLLCIAAVAYAGIVGIAILVAYGFISLIS